MSIRTIIEINHDYCQDLRDNPEAMKSILQIIQNCNRDRDYLLPGGVRYLGQRHHSETLALKVK